MCFEKCSISRNVESSSSFNVDSMSFFVSIFKIMSVIALLNSLEDKPIGIDDNCQ